MSSLPSLSLEQIEFCAQECFRQQSGELSVAGMCRAFCYMTLPSSSGKLSMDDILHLGKMIEPTKNKYGWRKIPVRFQGNPLPLTNHRNIPHQITLLVQHAGSLEPDEWYQEFEEIHPFIGGNGRVGAIIYNFLNGTMAHPVTPPNFKSA